MRDLDTFEEQLREAWLNSHYVGDYEKRVLTLLLERLGEPELLALIEKHAPDHCTFNDE